MDYLKNKKILITGGSGKLGCLIISFLLKNCEGIEILSIDNYSNSSKKNNIKHGNVKYVKLNSWHINRSLMMDDFNPDIVLHLGEYTSYNGVHEDANKILKYNINGISEVLEFCKRNSCTIVYFTYEIANQYENPLVWSKCKCTELINMYYNWFNLSHYILNISDSFAEKEDSFKSLFENLKTFV